jgi:hypothetical protein
VFCPFVVIGDDESLLSIGRRKEDRASRRFNVLANLLAPEANTPTFPHERMILGRMAFRLAMVRKLLVSGALADPHRAPGYVVERSFRC